MPRGTPAEALRNTKSAIPHRHSELMRENIPEDCRQSIKSVVAQELDLTLTLLSLPLSLSLSLPLSLFVLHSLSLGGPILLADLASFFNLALILLDGEIKY